MKINPHILSPEITGCPKDCPFLGMRTFIPNTLPFYCNQYETFLGITPAQKVARCPKCRGLEITTEEQGLQFINAFMVDHYIIERTKRAFLKLDSSFQKMFVSLVAQTGAQIILESDEDENPETFSDKILKTRQELKNKYGAPEVQEFSGILDSSFPLMERQTKTLLMNLFMVMDNSEKDMIKNIMINPKQADNFLKQFQKQPQDKDLLKNVRAVVYEADRKRQLEQVMNRQQDRHLQQERTRQQQERLRVLQLKKERQKVREHSR